jgi:hypothetical protein
MRYGSIAAFVAALLASLIIAIGAAQRPESPLPFRAIAVIFAIIGLGYGLRKRSRVCGSLLSVLLLGSIVWRMIETRELGTSSGGLIITFFVVMGTFAAFRWHRLVSDGDATRTRPGK